LQTGKFDRQSLAASRRERKVRAPQGRMLDNVQSARAEGSGHRNGPPMAAYAAQARMEPWCKRPRGALATLFLVNPIWSKTEENAAILADCSPCPGCVRVGRLSRSAMDGLERWLSLQYMGGSLASGPLRPREVQNPAYGKLSG